MARLLLTRPEEDARETARRLEERGHQVLVTPLMVIDVLGGGPLDLSGVQALLVTSVNGLRAFMHRQDGRVPGLPVFAVGDATARVAREMGFKDVKSAGGDVDDLARLAASHLHPLGGALLHPAASDVAGDLGFMLMRGGYVYRREIIYQARLADVLPAAAVQAIVTKNVDGVLLYSPRSAAIFDRLVKAADLRAACAHLTAYCLSENVARAAGEPWHDIRVAEAPEENSLLALIA